MNVLIAGEDVVGVRIAEELMHQHSVVYLAAEEIERLERLDVEAVYGSATSPDQLRQARVETADLFVACTASDEQNIVACIAAQRLGAKRTVCMLTRAGFLDVAGDDLELAESLGIDTVVRPAEELADEIIRIVTVPGALDVAEFAGGRIRLLRYAVEEGAPITSAPLSQQALPRHVNLVMLRRGDEMIVPRGDTHIRGGDKVVAMGRGSHVRKLLWRFLRNRSSETEKRSATVVGAGTVGFSVVRGLEEAGFRVKVIESDKERCEEVAPKLKSLVLHGDGADLDLLEQEGIGDSSVLVAVANNDEKNLLVSLLAKQLGVRRTVTRADRLANELMFEKVGIDVVRSAKGAFIRSVVRSVDDRHSRIRAELEHGDAQVIELNLPDTYPMVALRDLRMPMFARVGAVVRRRQLLVPRGEDHIEPGDQLLIFCTSKEEERVRNFFFDQVPRRGRRGEEAGDMR